MNFKKVVKITFILMIVVVLVNVGSVYGLVNTGYYADTVSQNWISSIVTKSNILIDPIMRFLYWLGNIIEYLIGSISSLTGSGNAVFPWSDAILFNAVPMLDINFFNPSPGALIGTLNNVIIKTYMTIFSIAVAFFGLIVLVMAIKLAISTIASEKAKYKEEIVKWATSLLLLFTIHYFMSFAFYANEQLVQVASNLVTQQLNDESLSFDIEDTTALDNLLVKNSEAWFTSDATMQARADFIKANKSMYLSILAEGRDVLKDFFHLDTWYVANGTEMQWITGFGKYIKNMSASDLNLVLDYKVKSNVSADSVKKMIQNRSGGDLGYSEIDLDGQLDSWKYLTKKYYNAFNTASPNYSKSPIRTPITDLATYFRRNAFTLKDGDVVADKPDYMFCMLYLIFCIQSLMYALAYIKRMFYIILLAIMAPAIVLFNYASGLASKASALSRWLKEFLTLVFIQSIQAFILAIIVVIIAATASHNQGADKKATNSGLGVVGIVALASISKVEALTKKILGVDSSVTDPSIRGGMKSWMTGMAAFKVASRIKDNAKLVGSGIRDSRSLRKDEVNAKRKMSNRLSLYNAGGAAGNNGGGNGIADTSGNEAGENSAVGNGSRSGSSGAGNSATAISGSGARANTKNLDRKDAMAISDMLDNYEDKIGEIRKKRSQARWNVIKGISETGGAIAGGIGGAAVGASTGEIDDMIKAAGFGIGIGDYAGEKAINIMNSSVDTMKALGKHEYKSIRSQNKELESKLKSQKEDLMQKLKDAGHDINNL